MSIKSSHILLTLNALTLMLILIVHFYPDNIFRIIIGLPFVLLFPGYALLSALFPGTNNLNSIERVALTFGASLAVVPLIGLILNYTAWGISFNSIIYSLSAFVFITSFIAWFRQRRLLDTEKLLLSIRFVQWHQYSRLEKILVIVLIIVFSGVMGTAVYAVTAPKIGETFTEFYLLNLEGNASDYQTELEPGEIGKITLGIINREQQEATYTVEVKINGIMDSTIGPILLENDEKYEEIATFKPRQTGGDQKVEFLLFKDCAVEPYSELRLWIHVK